MVWGISLATVIAGVAAGISSAIVGLVWRNRSETGAVPFVGLMGTLALWSLLYGVQLGYDALADQLVVQRLTLGVAGVVPTAWLLFALVYAGYDSRLRRRHVLLLLAEPAAFLLLCLTNPYHGLVWTDAAMTTTALGSVPALTWGVGYLVHIVYAYFAVAVGLGLFVLLGGRVSPMYQKQVLLLIAGTVPPFLTHVAFTLGVSPVPGVDLTPFVFSFTAAAFGVALFRFELLELTPVARAQSIEEMGDGLVVIDDAGVVVDLFGVATDVLEPTPRVSDSIESVFPDTDLEALDGTERSALVDGRRCSYRVQVSALRDHQGRRTGTMIMIRDVTGLYESEQRLRVSDRVLRHNLRNDMGVVHGYASSLERRLEGAAAADARRIRETAERLLELSEKARTITELHENGTGPAETVDVAEEIRTVVSRFREDSPDVAFRLDLPAEARLPVGDAETFRTAIRNVVENAVEHNDHDGLRVTVAATWTGEGLRIDVSDTGDGIPELEQRVLQDGIETPLHHGQGLGLWLTYWCVTTWGGELRLETDHEGSTVTITVPEDGATRSGDAVFGDAHA